MPAYNGYTYNGSSFTPVREIDPFLEDHSPNPAYDPRTLNQLSINDSGIIGATFQFNGVFGGALINGAVLTEVTYPSSSDTWLTGVNNNGDAVGCFNGQTQCFIRSAAGSFTSFSVPGVGSGKRQFAYGISASSTVVGFYYDTASVRHGFKRTAGGSFTTIDVAGADGTSIYGINAAGWLVGSYTFGNSEYGFFVDAGGAFTTGIDYPGTGVIAGSRMTFLRGISDAGVLVGHSSNGAHAVGVTEVAFTTTTASPSVFTRLMTPSTAEAQGISPNGGVIVGIG